MRLTSGIVKSQPVNEHQRMMGDMGQILVFIVDRHPLDRSQS
jgi:hypothetical protein